MSFFFQNGAMIHTVYGPYRITGKLIQTYRMSQTLFGLTHDPK